MDPYGVSFLRDDRLAGRRFFAVPGITKNNNARRKE